MALLLLAFTLLVGMATGSALWITESQTRDALVINLAGRQRMLLQQMSKVSLEWVTDGDPVSADQLRASMALFEKTLHALLQGGETSYLAGNVVSLPAARETAVREALTRLQLQWSELRFSLDSLLEAENGTPASLTNWSAVEIQSAELVTRADQVVLLYEGASEAKLARLRGVLLLFALGALGLLASGVLLIRGSLMDPLDRLAQAADRIGSGDLEGEVPIGGPSEIRRLASTLESTRRQLGRSTRDLEEQVERRTREVAALYEVSREISSRLDIDHVLRSVTSKAAELLEAEVAFLCLLDGSTQALILQSVSGPDEAARQKRLEVIRSPAEMVLARNEALECGVDGCGGGCAIVDPRYRISHLAAPLRVGDRAIGALCVGHSQSAAFSKDDVGLLTKLANSAAIALENARLYERAERVAMLEERQRIAAEIHDTLAQTLSFLELKAQQIADNLRAMQLDDAWLGMERMRSTLAGAGLEARSAIARLQEESTGDLSLRDQLGPVVSDASEAGGPAVDLVLDEQEPLYTTPDDARQIVRVLQEALQNVRLHAQATRVAVRVSQRESELALSIEDDGVGFDPSRSYNDGGRHYGMSIMRARAARLGGELSIDAAPGQGTRVVLRWPVGRHGASDDGDAVVTP